MTFSRQIALIWAVISDSKEWQCQNEPNVNKEEFLAASAENYSDFGMICEHDRKNNINWCSNRHCDIVPENA